MTDIVKGKKGRKPKLTLTPKESDLVENSDSIENNTDNFVETKVETKLDNRKIDPEVLRLMEHAKNKSIVYNHKDPFYVKQEKGWKYQWISTDKGSTPTKEECEEKGWREVKNYKKISTNGYTEHGQPGQHILMHIPEELYNIYNNQQKELSEAKKKLLFRREEEKHNERSGMFSQASIDTMTDFFKK